MNGPIDPEKIVQWIEGKDDGVRRDTLNYPSPGSDWYIISCSFLNRWKSWVGLSEFDFQDPEPAGVCIENADILLDSPDVLQLPTENNLKPGLTLGVDYEILPPKAWHMLSKKYPVRNKLEIKRLSVRINEFETQVEVYHRPVKVLIVNQQGEYEYEDPKIVYMPRDAPICPLKLKVILILKRDGKLKTVSNHKHLRTLKLDHRYSLDDIKLNSLKKPRIFPVHLIDEQLKFNQAQIADEDLVIIEAGDSAAGWKIEIPNHFEPFTCSFCKKLKNFGVKCPCGAAVYCNSRHLAQDEHCKSCVSPKSTVKPKQLHSPVSARRGLAGLQNLGNTCFMNSGLQCLSNTQFLTDYFLSNEYQADINKTNPLGTGGVLLQEYVNLLRELWTGDSPVVPPWKFKNTLGLFARQFSGYNQHDSQEMLCYLIDGLHADLNQATALAYSEERTECEGLTETELADRHWADHASRNKSLIVENMHGQYRSEVVCPSCKHSSLAFDPFVMVTVSIPPKESIVVDTTVVLKDPKRATLKQKITVRTDEKIRNIKEEIAKLVGIEPGELLMASVSQHSTLEKIYSDDELYDKDTMLYAYERPDAQENEGYIIVENYKEPLYNYTHRDKVPLSYPRILVVKKAATLQSLYFHIFKYFVSNLGIQLAQSWVEEFKSRFPRFFGKSGQNFLTIRFENPNREGGTPCPFCKTEKCMNCEVPFNESSVIEWVERSDCFKLEVLWSKDLSYSTISKLNRVEFTQSAQATKDIEENALTLSECLAYSAAPEQLDHQNKIYCKTCQDHMQMTKKLDIYRPPKILIFHLKRFKQVGYMNSRDSRLIEFPLNGLDLTPFCLTGAGVYDLYAVSNHYGGLAGGHYTAFAQNCADNIWYQFDDSRVTPVQPRNIVTKAAYILFYKRRE